MSLKHVDPMFYILPLYSLHASLILNPMSLYPVVISFLVALAYGLVMVRVCLALLSHLSRCVLILTNGIL